VGEVELTDLRHAIAEELDRLPAKYRCPVELCHLQGMTYDQAARQLDWPVATVKGRLTRGRLRLRERLARRGLAHGAFAFGVSTALTGDARAAVPQELVQSTARAAACAPGAFGGAVTALTEGVLKMMMWEKLKLVAVGALVAVGLTARVLSQPAPDGGIRAPRPLQTAARPGEKPNEKTTGDRRWVRILPCGAIVEVIGASSFPSGPNTWWRPDGTRLNPAPCDPNTAGISSDHDIPRLVVVRMSRIPEGAHHEWSIAEASVQSAGPAMKDGNPLPGLSEATAILPADAGTCTVLFKVAAGPWSTIEKWGKGEGAVGSRIGSSYIFGDAIATKKRTTLSVTHNIQDNAVRLIAIHDDGQELHAEIRSVSGVNDHQQIVVEFDQPPDRIKEFRLQTRPYEQVEIPRIALQRK
jgi:hypothetical protein